jgi:organic hydroperoxide reductase OsmC/OhrA
MGKTTIEYRILPGTRAAVGLAGTHSVIADLSVNVSIDFAGQPSRVSDARMSVECSLEDGADPSELVERAKRVTTIGNSLRSGFPVGISKQ